MVEIKCDYCKSMCFKRKCDIEAIQSGKKKNLFCSKQCFYKHKNRKTTVSCANCNRNFEKINNQIKKTKNNFCSQSCAAKFNNKLYPKRTRNSVKRLCPVCLGLTKNKNSITCSVGCSIQHRWNLKKIEIESSGIIYPKGMYYGSDLAKKYIAELNGNSCSICGITNTWNNKSLVLVLDHINGVPDDWHIENLRLVCPNCDSQLPTFKNKNKGNGRPKSLRFKSSESEN